MAAFYQNGAAKPLLGLALLSDVYKQTEDQVIDHPGYQHQPLQELVFDFALLRTKEDMGAVWAQPLPNLPDAHRLVAEAVRQGV